MFYYIIGVSILFGIAALWILAAVLASGKTPEPETWAICAWCGIWCSSEGRITSRQPLLPFTKTPELLSHGICPDCMKREVEQLKTLKAGLVTV